MNITYQKPKVGQILLREALRWNQTNPLEPTTVTKVGRKYFNTSCGREYHLDNWRQRHSDATRLWVNQQALDDHKERLKLESRFREKFSRFFDPNPLSLDKLRAIAAILDPP